MTGGDSKELIADGLMVFERGTDQISSSRILYVGEFSDSVLTMYPLAKFENLHNHMLIPGMINCHTHSGMSLFRGFGDDMALHEWLNECIFPVESHFVSPEFIELGTRLAIFEMLKTGTTTFVDQYYHCEVAAELAHSIGIRIACGEPIIDLQDGQFGPKIDRAFAVTENLTQYPSEWVIPIINPHACYTVPRHGLEEIDERRTEFRVNTHLHESREECLRFGNSHHGKSAMEILIECGLFGPNLIAAHCVCLSSAERQLLATHRVNVVHCPKSNLKLSSGVCPVQALLDLGVNVALGTDGAASNNSLSMISEMQVAALIGKTVAVVGNAPADDEDLSPTSKSTGITLSGSPTAVSCHTVLRMATYNGAIALGMDHLIGSLEVGKLADICAIDLSSPECLPIFDPVSALVYSTGARVGHLWIGGEKKVDNGIVCVEIDESQIANLVIRMKQWINTKESDDA